MTIRKPWKVVSGTLAAAVTLGSTAAVAQVGNDMPDTMDLDDVVTIDEVTVASITSLFEDPPKITLDDSVVSVSDSDADDTATIDDQDETDLTPSMTADESASVESASVESASVESASVESASADTPSADTPSFDSADSDDSA